MTPLQLAMRFVGEIHEQPLGLQHPLIQWWLSLCGFGFDAADEIPWCSAFINGIAWELRLPRSKSAAARSWLGIGTAVDISLARAEADVVILKRGTNPIQGHVGFFAGAENGTVRLCGGNQADGVTIASFPVDRVVGVRRLT